jgi:GR25 family glycosyltransferase involved in LPS biosynthesis
MSKLHLVDKIYIIHYKPLTERKKKLEDKFKSLGIENYEFRTLYQREDLTDEIKEQYFKLHNLAPAQICITIEHIETYREIINNNFQNWCLILEDDADLCHDFVDKLNHYLKNIPADADYLDINDYSKCHTVNLWEKYDKTRTTCSYLIKKSTCEKLMNTIIPFEKAIDHEMNRQIKIHNLNNYWSREALVHHGSFDRTVGSSYVMF